MARSRFWIAWLSLFMACGTYVIDACADCGGDCNVVSPVDNVPINLDQSSAVRVQIDAAYAYKIWAYGDSWHAPDCCGHYTAVLGASPWGDAELFSIPIGGDPVLLSSSPVGGDRYVFLFFVEFGSGYLGDNGGSTTVYYQKVDGGPVGSVVVDPVQNNLFNCATSNAQVRLLDLNQHQSICATGWSQYANVPGYYNGVYLCVQWGCRTTLLAIPIDEAPLFLSATGITGTTPAYLWFPEFGSGYLGDNSGATSVCFGDAALAEAPSVPGSDLAKAGGVVVAPNPADTGTRVLLLDSVASGQKVSLSVFDASGRLVRSLDKVAVGSDGRTLYWDCRDQQGAVVPRGIYFVRAAGEHRISEASVTVIH